jgi:hypothetical protein
MRSNYFLILQTANLFQNGAYFLEQLILEFFQCQIVSHHLVNSNVEEQKGHLLNTADMFGLFDDNLDVIRGFFV